VTDDAKPCPLSSVVSLSHVRHAAVRRAGLSATADPCIIMVWLLCVCVLPSESQNKEKCEASTTFPGLCQCFEFSSAL